MDEKEYEVTITEVLEKKVRYRGRNELEATAKAEADYYAEKIVLGADDFSYRDISAKELVPVKYTNENGHISIELFTLENYTKIAITDSGIGIKESEIPKLFQRFYRSPSVKNFPGVGVGLHLAQDIISRQYGFIHVFSTLHVGSTFEIWLINSDSPK